MARLLLLMPKSTYRAEAFLEGAARAGLEARVGSDVCRVLHERWATGALPLRFDDPEQAAAEVVEGCRRAPVDAIVPVTDAAVPVAALASARLGLPGNPPRSAEAARNKRLLREALAAAGVPQPAFETVRLGDEPAARAARAPSPCVLKPALLSGSRGVIRADDAAGFEAAFHRIARLLRAERGFAPEGDRDTVLIERYVPGHEVALEGLLSEGRLRALALFDKPDPMEGPLFEETLLLTPSRLDDAVQERVRVTAEAAARALGLRTGPVHAELRVHQGEPVVIEVAARTIGGLCGRALRFAGGDVSLEELVLRHAAGQDVSQLALPPVASGVMMIPIPKPGVLEGIEGIDRARAVEHVQDVVIGAPIGTKLVPLPEAADYLGFVFARADAPAQVERALRDAHAALRFRIARTLT